MKPILLKLAGLQSYREPQEIDFEQLCETGLFGIFGPTGSGKSTLLDAITLAMYGKVERAVNGTQGIMNHSENSLFVSFTFELQSSQGPERYRVERRFKRMNELSISNTISRFVHITEEGESVLADKLADVTRCVEEKIGLKMDDFTRAVVLPQGKFAEFLSLKGSERRQMLQRLFHLERYGDLLAMKLSRRVKDNDGALKSVEAEQQGLGSAGKEAVAAAETALEEAVGRAVHSRRNLQQILERNELLGRLRELDSEEKRLQSKLNELEAQEAEIGRLERGLELAAAAKQLLPVLKLREEASQKFEELQIKSKGLKLQAEQADREAEAACAKDDAAQAALAAEEPKLLLRAEQLEQAAALQRERDMLRGELAKLGQQREEARTELRRLEGVLLKEKELLERGQKRRDELKENLKQLETRASDRQLLQEALKQQQAVSSMERQLHQAEAEMQSCSDLLNKAEAELAEAHRAEADTKDELKHLILASIQLRGLTEEAAGLAEQGAAFAEEAEQKLEDRLREEQLHSLALSLAAELREGEACPVCGSKHHPEPAQSAAAAGRRHSEEQGALRKLKQEIQGLQLALRQQANEALVLPQAEDLPEAGAEEGAMEQAQAAVPEASAFIREAAAALAEDETALADLQKLQGFSAALRAVSEAHGQLISRFREQSGSLNRKLAAQHQDAVRKTAAAENARQNLRQLADKRKQLDGELEALKAGWKERSAELPLEEAEARFKEMQDRDAKAEAIKEGLERSVPFIEEKKALVQQLENELRELEKQLIQWDAQHQGDQKLLQEKEDRLEAWIGATGSAKELLAACKGRLQLLRETAEGTRSGRKAAEELKQQMVKAAAIAAQAAESAEEHVQSAEKQWLSQLEDSPFAAEGEVRDSLMSSEEADRAALTVTTHREQQKEWALRLKDVQRKLEGTAFNEEEWQECCRSLEECRREDELAIQQKARAERDLEDLRKRHVRFMELEQQRVSFVKEGERLAKLQSVLRGNAFVEYIAEEQLMQVSQAASQRLRFLTKQRYSLEVDSGGGFVIRDDANGGVRRPVSTLSGGETFLTSLSLALALSAQIQLRGQYPLQFFFLDEGFGTLDPELLDTVITSLERLHNDKLTVGIISHVAELRGRLPRKLVIRPAGAEGSGSQIILEKM